MNKRRDKLRVDSVRLDTGGEIGMTLCPGKKERNAMAGDWDRDLGDDLRIIRDWGAVAVVSVITQRELDWLRVGDMGDKVKAAGMKWYLMPIRDGDVPDQAFEQQWESVGPVLRDLLRNHRKILIHCKGGLGRTGMIAARLLVELGEASPREAMRRVRAARRGAIENCDQERHVLGCKKARVLSSLNRES